LHDVKRLRRACAAAIVAAAVVPAAAQARSTVVVKTPQGTVRGIRAAGADRFLGLPYAKPPVKSRRFRPPVAAVVVMRQELEPLSRIARWK
jgi:para-nitrobenzyl esterase